MLTLVSNLNLKMLYILAKTLFVAVPFILNWELINIRIYYIYSCYYPSTDSVLKLCKCDLTKLKCYFAFFFLHYSYTH